ncbi:MAG: hypothetical protein JST00_10780 [Deltaproteobacteria bacterium]|nr:hypothetical protein [Deltaproteobacteria bacterium]
MRLLARSSALIAITSALVVAPAVAGAQAPPPGGPAAPAPPPPGGPPAAPGAAGAPAATTDSRTATQKNLDAPGEAKVEKRDAAGFTFTDKPAVRRGPFRAVRSGPLATFPGFEQLPDGGSRLFVQLSQSVPVEERRAQGSITYVLKGAHVRVHNDTNTLVTVHFNTPISTAKLLPSGNDTLLVVNLRAASTPTFKVQDNQDKTSTLMIDFAKGDFAVGENVPQAPDTPAPAPARKVGRKKGAPAPSAPPPAPAGPKP